LYSILVIANPKNVESPYSKGFSRFANHNHFALVIELGGFDMTQAKEKENDIANIKLVSEQARRLIGEHDSTTQKLDTKLSIGVIVGGVFLRMAGDLPEDNTVCLVCKLIAIGGFVGCTGICLQGIWPAPVKAGATKPSYIQDEWFDLPTEVVLSRITQDDIALEEAVKARSYWKGKILRRAFVALALGIAALGIGQVALLISPTIADWIFQKAWW